MGRLNQRRQWFGSGACRPSYRCIGSSGDRFRVVASFKHFAFGALAALPVRFSSHQPPSSQELQHSALWDPRWFELFLAHVKEMDSYQETRKKFSKQGLPNPKKPEDPPKVTKAEGKAQSKGRLKREGGGGRARIEALPMMLLPMPMMVPAG